MSKYRQGLLPGSLPVDGFALPYSRGSRLGYRISKRCFDIIGVLLLAPFVILIIAIAAMLVRLDGGKAFYTQSRVGKDGENFRLWKLRSMRPDAPEVLETYLHGNPEARIEWEENQKLKHDPRITAVGHFLRKYSIDELPQLLNVAFGQMSLVGPRPILPEQRRQYPGIAYFSMKPGMTGMWQVSERNGCTFAERATYDNRYADVMSLGLDIRILMKTVGVVFHGTGF